ncbi:putative terminase large subunit [Pseudomonas phage UAntarctica]|nr:putative terminase large subunit [Pseudomonas phage UAntarctica]
MSTSITKRFRMALNREEGMSQLDRVVMDYGVVGGAPFSFEDHEFQIEIMRDTHSRVAVRKCSQVGLSELMVQKCLALSAVLKNNTIMFSLPTKEMATKFSKHRFDGGIEGSEYYSGLMSAGENAAGMKKLGSSYIYIIGTFGDKSAISTPAEMIISDEVDFSNPIVLGKLNSRIRHAKSLDEKGNRGYVYRFSTPTVEGFGIDNDFQKGDQRYYLCKCEHCETWVEPHYLTDFVIPGWDKGMLEFSRDNLGDPRYDTESAYIACSHCKRDLFASLCNPARRQWVAKKTENWNHSYQVNPWDVPTYNTPQNIVRQYDDYPLKSDFFNFVLGLPFSDSENTFLTTEKWRATLCDVDLWVFQNCVVRHGTVGGMDVGKICHMVVKVRAGTGWHIIWMEKIHNTQADPATPAILARFDFYGMRKLCIDAGPDITLVNLLVSARENIQAVVYTTVSGFQAIEEKKAGDVINADRSKTLTLLMQDHNSGKLHYPGQDNLKIELFQHLATTKKIREPGADGVMKERFVKTDKQDHWVHALNYANIAGLAAELWEGTNEGAALPGVTTVRVGSRPKEQTQQVETGHVLQGMFGFKSQRAFKR